MPVVIVVGVQWGDEGKGKVVDYLTERANLVVRFQGGNNAGHTVIVEGQKTALKLIPSGILRAGTRCLLASGVVVEPHSLIREFESLREVGIELTPVRFGIAREVTLIMPYHIAIDTEREQSRAKADNQIGTTGRGIGPAYEDSVSRYAIRMEDLFDPPHLEQLVRRNVDRANAYLSAVLDSEKQFDAKEIYSDLMRVAEELRPYITDVTVEVAEAERAGRLVVFEGAQGCLLDITHGTYPYVTSSNTMAAYACVSAGFGPKKVDTVLGICKAYATRVGSGPFPTEDFGSEGERLREVGREFGTVTGRPRRCGWFDAVAVRRAVRLNGIDSLIITKLDVLSGLERIKVAGSYDLGGEKFSDLSVSSRELSCVTPEYEELPGWEDDITKVRSFEELPANAKSYLRRLGEISECEIGGFSVGPERSQTIVSDPRLNLSPN